MTGAANGQKLSQSLNNAKDNGFENAQKIIF
jgi:hypothetical protein